MRIGVVGVGSMGRLHAQLLVELAGADALLIADVKADRAEALATELGVRAIAADEILGKADALVIATPPEWHAPMLEAAIEAGRPALCEKPLAFDLPETLAVAERVERAGATVQVGFQRRFDAGFTAAHRLASGGALGDLHLVRLAAHDPRRAPLGSSAVGGRRPDAAPLFRDSSIHDFDLVRWLTGDEVVEIHVDGSDRDGLRPADAALLETALVSMRLSRGGMAALDATLLDPRGYDVRAELVGSKDSVTVGLTPRTPLRGLDPDATPPGTAWTGYLERFREAYRRELETFLAVARGEAPSPVTVRDAAEAMRLAVAATRSFAERRRVALDEIPGMPAARREEVA